MTFDSAARCKESPQSEHTVMAALSFCRGSVRLTPAGADSAFGARTITAFSV
jgi:hypothetical protein